MAGYLEGYGVGEERRARVIKRLLLSALLIAIAAGTLYFTFRNYREKKQIQTFIELLRKQDYQSAYRLWGCTESTPCRDYSFDRFMEDWGPKSLHPDAASFQVSGTRSCSTGIIATLETGKAGPVLLWVERRNETLSFAPWPVCSPRMKPPASTGL